VEGITGNKHFLLVWDTNGDLFSWLNKSPNTASEDSQFKQQIINQIPLNNEKIIMATCAVSSCCALNEKGEIHYWNR